MGTVYSHLTPWTYVFRIAKVAQAEVCFNFVNATSPKVFMANAQLQCNITMNMTYASAHFILPLGWFLTCGTTAYTHMPANSTEHLCTIGRVTLSILPYLPMPIVPHHGPLLCGALNLSACCLPCSGTCWGIPTGTPR
uniref:Uncharacterized protein n=1 Tax=Strix occidentalis caurina TaxID=311401 RepID=A0A8D0KZM4_STROC